MLYVGRVWLRYTDSEVLALTPKQFQAQLKVHSYMQDKMNGAKTEEPGHIDQLNGW